MPKVSIKDLGLTFFKIGTIGFGGGVAMLALIRQNVVQKLKWITDEDLSVAVAIGQILPGPFVPNYVEYIGYQLKGLKGMIVSAIAFLLPSFLAMIVLSSLYFRFQNISVLQQIFVGIQPVIAGILLWASLAVGKVNVRNRRSLLIALLAFLALVFRVDVLLTVLICGILGIIFFTKRKRIGSLVILTLIGLLSQSLKLVYGAFSPLKIEQSVRGLTSSIAKAFELFGIFFKIGSIIFGGGYAAIPFIKHEIVDLRNWLTAKEFIDGVALGQITPGPVAITATFVGFKVLGIIGATIATIGIFLPSFLLLLLVIRIFHRIRNEPLVQGFLAGVKPAIVGMLFSATIFIGTKSINNYPAGIIGLLSFLLLIRFKLDPIWLILSGGLLGWIVNGLL